MKIWAKVFADRPGQLVRVVGAKNDNPWVAGRIMQAPGIADNVDAIATAPYFAIDLPAAAAAGTSVADQMIALRAAVATTLDRAAQNKAVATKYGKRFITYEGGQHLTDFTTNGGARVAALNADPAMYDVYKAYLAGARALIGDTVTLYSATGPASGGGAWGIQLYAGQPVEQAPKRRAALEFTR